MRQTIRESTLLQYPEIDGILSDSQWEALANTYLQSSEDIQKWMEPRIRYRILGNNAVRLLIDRPQVPNGNAFVVLGEYGNGLVDTAVVRGLAAYNAVNPSDKSDPSDAFIVFPNDTATENNLGLTKQEREQLKTDSTPLTDRLLRVLDQYEEVTILGPSQGATVGAHYAAHRDSQKVALAAVEPPDVASRSTIQLLRDFNASLDYLAENIQLNDPELRGGITREHIARLGLVGLMRYGIGMARPSNLALHHLLTKDTFGQNVTAALAKESSVVHIWTPHSSVSRKENNWQIAKDHDSNEYYLGLQVGNKYGTHAATNVGALAAASTSKARQLLHAA